MNERGYTMLEFLISTALGGVTLLGLSGFYLSSLRFNDESGSRTYLQRQGTMVLEEMARQIRPASLLSAPPCTPGSANSLQVTNTSGTFTFRQSGSQFLEDLPGGTGTRNLLSTSLSPLTVTPDSFCPVVVSGSGVPDTAVIITFQLKDQTSYDTPHNLLTFKTTLAKRN